MPDHEEAVREAKFALDLEYKGWLTDEGDGDEYSVGGALDALENVIRASERAKYAALVEAADRPRTNRSNLLDMLIERDGAVCRACGTTADLTIDHALPVSLGGKWEMSNLQLLCSACNGAKGNKHLWFPVRKKGTNE